MIRLVLPYPISTNTMWRRTTTGGVPRTYLTDAGKAYKRAVSYLVTIARSNGEAPREAIAGRVKYELVLYPPDRRKRDLSNCIKVLEDAITDAGVWVDDEQIDDFRVKRGPVTRDGRAVIEIDAL